MNQRPLAALLVLLFGTAPALANAAVYSRYVWSPNNTAPNTANATFAICQPVPADLPCPAQPGAAMTAIISGNPVAYQPFVGEWQPAHVLSLLSPVIVSNHRNRPMFANR